MTPNMRQNLGFKTKFADGLTVRAGLFGRGGRGKFNVLHAKLVQGFRDLDFFGRVEEGVGELLAFSLRI
jgi:hypothetical protein